MSAAPPMQVACVRVRLHPDSRDAVLAWAAAVRERRAEALATLEAEGVALESAFLEPGEPGAPGEPGSVDHLVIYLRARDLAHAQRVGRELAAPLQALHRAFQQATWARVTPLELLFDLERCGPR